jgi:hypothetical protein
MQVFTTIFLAETLPASAECVDGPEGLDQDLHGPAEFKQALRERIAMLESRSWFEDNGFDEG